MADEVFNGRNERIAQALACCVIEVEDEMALAVRSEEAPRFALVAPQVVCAAEQSRELLVPQAGGGLARLDLGLLPPDVVRRLFQRLRSSRGVVLFALDGEHLGYKALGTLSLPPLRSGQERMP